jgi:hypothetical protein
MPPDEDTGAGSQSIPREANLREATEGPRSALASLPTTPAHPAVEFTRGVLLARASDFAAATVALRAAMDGDSVRTRAPVAVAERIRSVAPRAGFTLRDTAQALTARAPGGLSGWESFSDNCHMTDPRFQEEAEAVLDLARGSPPGGVLCGVHARPPPEDPAGQLQNLVSLAPRGPESGSSPWYRALSLMLESRALNDGSAWAEVARAYAASLRGEPAWISHVRGAIAEGLWRAGRRDDAETVNALGRASAGPVAAAAWMQRGLFSLRQGDRERAAAEFRRAVAMDPSSYEARWYAERARRP